MSTIVVNTREEWINYWLKCYSVRNPDADVGPGSYPWLRASVMADTLIIMSNDALAISDAIPLDNMTGLQLDAKYGSKLPRNLDTKSSGLITFSGGPAGATIVTGDLLSNSSTKNQYQVISVTNAFTNGQQIAVESVDPGLGQNLAPGAVLQWTSPRPGSYATAVVFSSPDGEGIIGGRTAESDDEYRNRIRDWNANPVGHGNEGDIATLIEASREHGVPVEKSFVYPAIHGPGSASYSFTVKRDNYWESRAPTATQRTLVYAYVASQLPGDFALTPSAIIEQDAFVDLSVDLDTRSAQWTDATPWPVYAAYYDERIIVSAITSPLVFELNTQNGLYSGVIAPSIGNTIAMYDRAFGVFRRKKILTVTGTGPWAITCDSSALQSDTSFTPTFGLSVSPWFDAINDCSAEAGKHVALLGPGEAVPYVSIPEDGTRMRRQPRPYPAQFDDRITQSIAFDVQTKVPSVATCLMLSAIQTPPVGSALVNNLLTIADLGIFKA